MPILVIVGGLPGTGKSTLAQSLGHELGAPVLNRDVIEASLRRSGLDGVDRSRRPANDLLATLAGDILGQDRSVIVDSVFGEPDRLDELGRIATGRSATCRSIECVCGDLVVHRSRIEGRVRAIPGWAELTWGEVESTRSRYPTRHDERLVLDSVDDPAVNLAAAIAYCR
jgi:hypothetical protein